MSVQKLLLNRKVRDTLTFPHIAPPSLPDRRRFCFLSLLTPVTPVLAPVDLRHY